ncbi:MAG: WxL domain-containing protein [Lactococcus sp.]|nr:WxL domain-containing protein [Lactococcus sp.]
MELKTLLKRTTILASVVTTGAILTNATVSHADTTYSDATHAKTQSDLTFIKSDTPTPPKPPGPQPNPAPNPTPNPNRGELVLSYASDLNFGTHLKSDTTFFAKADVDSDGIKFLPFIAVEDNRGSERKGWKLTAKQDSPFKSSKDNKKELAGATISLSNLFFDDKAGAPKAVSGDVILSSDAKDLATAGTTTGIGSWSLGLGKLEEGVVDYTVDKSGKSTPVKGQVTKGVKLSIPSTSVKDSDRYTTTITYELIADPTA